MHVSGQEAIEQIRWAHGRGLRIYAETCPQYLFLTADDLGGARLPRRQVRLQPAAARPREPGGGLGRPAATALFQVFSSDHAPFRYDDPKGKKPRRAASRFATFPNGIPGLETRLPLLFSAGVNEGRIDLCQFVALTATNAAKMYGLYPRKGSIAIGADADLAIWDPSARSRSPTTCCTTTSTTRRTKACACAVGR